MAHIVICFCFCFCFFLIFFAADSPSIKLRSQLDELKSQLTVNSTQLKTLEAERQALSSQADAMNQLKFKRSSFDKVLSKADVSLSSSH
jgi:hypothetical protein